MLGGGGAPATPVPQLVKPQCEDRGDDQGQGTSVVNRKKLRSKFTNEGSLLEY
jgi:hypothetical protein